MGREQERHRTRLTNIRSSSVHKCDFPKYKRAAKNPTLSCCCPGGCVFVIVFTDVRDSAAVSDQFKQNLVSKAE